MTPSQALQSLRRRIRRWGGTLLLLTPEAYARQVGTTVPGDVGKCYPRDHNPWDECPFADGHAVWWERRLFAVSRPHLSLPVLIHEMGHVFADLRPPADADEYAWFGWEYALAQALGIEEAWRVNNKRYGVGTGVDFGELSRPRQDALLAERLQEARTTKLVDARNRPCALR